MAPSRFAFHALVGIRRVVRNDQFVIVGLSIIVGCLSAFGAIAFREAIDIVQWLAFGYADVDLASHVAGMPWWQVVAVPTLGGLVIGILLRTTMPGGLPQGVPHVMEACALRGGRMPLLPGIAAAVISATSLGVGSSTGREGPVDIGLLRHRREHQDRGARVMRHVADPGAERDPVHTTHLDVEEEAIERHLGLGQHLERAFRRGAGLHFAVFGALQHFGEKSENDAVVVDSQDFHGQPSGSDGYPTFPDTG